MTITVASEIILKKKFYKMHLFQIYKTKRIVELQ